MKGGSWLVIALLQLAACRWGGPSGSIESPADAGAGSDALPQVAPCEVLGLPGAPTTRVVYGSVHLPDIDGDGKLDLLVVGAYNSVSVYPGNGDASFRASIDSMLGDPTTFNVGGVAIADLDGDGKLDLVLASEVYDASSARVGSVRIELGDGTGRFQPGSSYLTDAVREQSFVEVADLDGDGKPDLVLGGSIANTVQVRLGHGDGTFGEATEYPVGRRPTAVAVADLDGDGKPDVIVTNYADATVSILRGNGDGTFKAKVDRDTGAAPGSIATADLNGDGKVDLVIRGSGVSLLVNDGTGALLDRVDYTLDSQDDLYAALAVGDVNGDGKPDVVAIGGASVAVLAGTGDGTLLPAVATAVSPTPSGNTGVALGDVNGDNALDVIISSSIVPGVADSVLVSVLQSDGSGGLLSPTTYSMGAGSSAVAAADLNGDGYVDLVLTSTSSINIALGRSEGRFHPLVRYPVDGPTGPVAVVDVSGDGKPDLVVRSTAGVSVLLGHGDGSFLDPVDSPVSIRYGFVVGDLSGDGKPDLVVGDTTGLFIYLGNGDGTFHSGGKLAEIPFSATASQLAIGDLDGDGRLDVVAAFYPLCLEGCPATYYADVLLNRETGLLHTSFGLGRPEGSLTIADVDHDGKLDVVTASRAGLSVRRGNGDGTLQPLVFSATPGESRISQIVDFTGDGKLDIIGVSSFGTVTISPGNGDGTFRSALTYLSSTPYGIAIADINRDGRLDIITPGDTFGVLFARCVR